MKRRNKDGSQTHPYYGLAALCVGVGQDEATIIEYLG